MNYKSRTDYKMYPAYEDTREHFDFVLYEICDFDWPFSLNVVEIVMLNDEDDAVMLLFRDEESRDDYKTKYGVK